MDGVSIGVLMAFSAGLLSFLSPCVLPLIPSYASFITGMSMAELSFTGIEGMRRRRTALAHGIVFVSGFTFIFMMLGAGATLLGSMFGYSTQVRTLSSGKATFTMTFDHYEPVPFNLAEEIVASRAKLLATRRL